MPKIYSPDYAYPEIQRDYPVPVAGGLKKDSSPCIFV
jgi:hypothetical protein